MDPCKHTMPIDSKGGEKQIIVILEQSSRYGVIENYFHRLKLKHSLRSIIEFQRDFEAYPDIHSSSH
jgi:hypothetical protein